MAQVNTVSCGGNGKTLATIARTIFASCPASLMIIPAEIVIEMLSAAMFFLTCCKVSFILLEVAMPFHAQIPLLRLKKGGLSVTRIPRGYKTSLVAGSIISNNNRVSYITRTYRIHETFISFVCKLILNNGTVMFSTVRMRISYNTPCICTVHLSVVIKVRVNRNANCKRAQKQ